LRLFATREYEIQIRESEEALCESLAGFALNHFGIALSLFRAREYEIASCESLDGSALKDFGTALRPFATRKIENGLRE
jgi:hypothetical protein